MSTSSTLCHHGALEKGPQCLSTQSRGAPQYVHSSGPTWADPNACPGYWAFTRGETGPRSD